MADEALDGSPIEAPENWTHLSGTTLDTGESISYEHDERALRGHVMAGASEYQSYIVNSDGEYVVYPETFSAAGDALERLRMHMEYYS